MRWSCRKSRCSKRGRCSSRCCELFSLWTASHPSPSTLFPDLPALYPPTTLLFTYLPCHGVTHYHIFNPIEPSIAVIHLTQYSLTFYMSTHKLRPYPSTLLYPLIPSLNCSAHLTPFYPFRLSTNQIISYPATHIPPSTLSFPIVPPSMVFLSTLTTSPFFFHPTA
jgi:hypothetical protein